MPKIGALHQMKNTSHKHNGSRIDLRLANRSGSMLLRAYAVCDGILPNDRSELHIDIDLPIGKLWKYIPVQPNLNYDILQEIQPKNCDPPIVDISAQLYLVLDQGKTDKAFPVWCLIAEEGYFKKFHVPTKTMTQSMTPVQAGGKYVFRDNVCSLSNPMHSRSICAPEEFAQAIPRARELLRTNLHLHKSQNAWQTLAKAVPSIQKPY